jgi:hypothetical protein
MCDTANRNAERQRHNVDAQEPIGERAMTEEKAGKRTSAKSDNEHKAGSDGLAIVETVLPPGSPQRAAVGVAAAAGGALVAVAMLGVGPAALAGAAGYLVYREIYGQEKK